jgi:hypothetical protein
MYTREAHATRETPRRGREDQPDAREGWAGRLGVSERLVLPLMPGNAGGGKEPQFKTDVTRSEGPEIGKSMCDVNEGLKDRRFGATEVDEGRPLDVGRQRQASNQAVRLELKRPRS